MSEQGSHNLYQSEAIMVVAAAQDEQAIALVQAMRQAGLRVTFAETVHIAVRASEAAACVAVLRPDTWKTQAIATVMRAKPNCLIPALAEAMDTPRGPWTHPAISLADAPEEGTEQIIQAVREYLDTRSRQVQAAQSKSADIVTIDQMLKTRKRRQRRRVNFGPMITTFLLLIILGLGGLLGYRYYTTHPTKLGATTSSGNLNTVPHVVYSATTPGQYCDGGGGAWGLGDRYVKTENKQKVEVVDKYTTLQCKPDGALLTRSGDYSVYSELFFDGINASASLSQHYAIQVDATIISGDTHASITMDAHIHNNGYGRYAFNVNTLGHWNASTLNTIDGSSINRLAIGFLPKGSKTFTLKVEVNGPVMTFWINGIRVTTVTDTTYADNSTVGFGVDDWSATAPISALFSNFKYEELTPSTLTTSNLVATATAQTQATMQTPYSAQIPGYGCDTGAGQWQPLADINADGTLNCLSNGMQLTTPANAKDITSQKFYWLNGYFPQNYKISAQVNVGVTAGVCAGMSLREDSHSDRYAFTICSDGSWRIDYSGNTDSTLAKGNVRGQSTYTLTAQANGSALSISINNQLIQTVNDTHLATTDHISLFTGYYQLNQDQNVMFSNFVFTPLP